MTINLTLLTGVLGFRILLEYRRCKFQTRHYFPLYRCLPEEGLLSGCNRDGCCGLFVLRCLHPYRIAQLPPCQLQLEQNNRRLLFEYCSY